ncbi:ABC transporter permease [Anaeromicropila herbilytica]|uniref:Sulfonate ABC transporter permease n=1 Tax=Anaeromicropila herbilytica TaxID=2785025 RepID=A0A7R7EMS1_9FIRM|nr:ABC transporter permease [Anaeromicropila herbilytica]BCN31648.1 sulfonate ABC transporter permease [Anaeromicropila herbilytica]
MVKNIKKVKHVIVSFIVLIAIWQLVFITGEYNEALFPSSISVGKAFIEMFTQNYVILDIWSSLYRFLIGYLSAVISAILLGLFLGWFPKVFAYVNPIFQLIRPISPMAWLPFIVLWFGIGDMPAIVIIFIAAFFPVLLTTISAVGNVDKTYLKVAKNFGIKRLSVIFKIVFPAAFPQIATSLHLALGSAWVFLVAGEMSGAQSGLGYLIIDARNSLRTDLLMGTILLIGIIGFTLDSIIKFIELLILKNWGVKPGDRR